MASRLSKIFKGKKPDSSKAPPTAAAPPPAISKPVPTSTAPKANPGYTPDLDLEGKVFKLILTQDGGKDEIVSTFMAHQINIDEKSPKRYGFFERGVSAPVHIILATQNIFIIDGTSFEIKSKVSVFDIKEVIIEVADNGLFCIDARKESGDVKQYFVASPVPALLSDVLVAFQTYSKQTGNAFIVTHRSIFTHSYIERFNNNRKAVGKILDDLSANGFADTDIWNGSVDLRPWIKKYQKIIQPGDKDQTFVVEFNFVSTGEKVYYKPSEHVVVQKVLETLSVKAKLDATKLSLAPIKGCEMNAAATFGAYGLGLLFDSWQLNVVEKDSIRVPVTVTIPASIVTIEKATVPSVTYKCLNVGRTLTKDFVARICKEVGISGPHRFTLMHTMDDYGGVFEDAYPISAHGVNQAHGTLKLLYKTLPAASGDARKDKEVAVDGLAAIMEAVEASIKEKRKEKMGVYIRQLVVSLGDTAVEELAKAQTIKGRFVCLNDEGKKALCKLMDDLESEELAVYNIPGQRRLMERARDFVWNNIPPAPPITAPPKKPPPPPVPPKPTGKTGRVIQLRGGLGTHPDGEEIGPNGEMRVRATIEIGGSWSGPPGTLDLLAARQRLKPVSARSSGWDKSADNVGLGHLANMRETKKQVTNEIPPEALELFLKLKKRHQMIEAASNQDDAEDLGD